MPNDGLQIGFKWIQFLFLEGLKAPTSHHLSHPNMFWFTQVGFKGSWGVNG